MQTAALRPEPVTDTHAVWSIADAFTDRPGPQQQEAKQQLPSTDARGGRFTTVRRLLVAAAAMAVVALGVILFRIATDRGELIVRSEDPNARLLIQTTEGKPVRELTLEQGNGQITIRSGQYAVRLFSDIDSMAVDKNQITVSRGRKTVLTVQERPAPAAQDAAAYGSAMGMGMAAEMGSVPGMMSGEGAAGMESEMMGGMMSGSGYGMDMGGDESAGMEGGMGAPAAGMARGSMDMEGGEEPANMASGMGASMGMAGGMGSGGPSGMGSMGMGMPGSNAPAGAGEEAGADYGSGYGSGYGSAYGSGYAGEAGMLGAGIGYIGPGSARQQARQQLAYDGKMYRDWLQELRTERNPQRVLEAVKALAVLAPEAGSDDAAEVLIRVMRSYGVVEDQYGGDEEEKYVAQISQQIFFTLLRMEPEAVAKAIAREINDGNTNSRQFLIFLITNLNYSQPSPAVKRLRTSLSEQAEQMVSDLSELSRSKDQNVSRWAIRFAAALTTNLNLEPDNRNYKNGLASILKMGLQSTDTDTLVDAAGALAQIAPDTEGLAEALVRLADMPTHRIAALDIASKLGKRASIAMPTLMQILKNAAERQNVAASSGEGEYDAMEADSGYGYEGGFPGGGAFGMGGYGSTDTSREITETNYVLHILQRMDPKDVATTLPLIRTLAAESSPCRAEARKVLTMLGEPVE